MNKVFATLLTRQWSTFALGLIVSWVIVCLIFLGMHNMITTPTDHNGKNYREHNDAVGNFSIFDEGENQQESTIDFISEIIPYLGKASCLCCADNFLNMKNLAKITNDTHHAYSVKRHDLSLHHNPFK